MIVDTHIHLYDPSRPQGIPWPPEDNDLLYRTVLPEHFKAVANPVGVTHTVVVEASVWVEDNDWVLDVAKDESVICGFVGNLDPQDDGYTDNLDRLAKNELFCGVRLRRKELDTASNPETLSAMRALSERDLEMDLLARPADLATVAGIAQAIPDLRIVCNHVGHVQIDGQAPDPEWVAGLNAIAAYPNVYMKISGFVEVTKEQPAPTDPAYYEPVFNAMWEILGEDRLIYGSNWPVCERAGSYETVFSIADAFFTLKGTEAKEKYFTKNGRKAYKWVEQ